jgi:hypothetical protein
MIWDEVLKIAGIYELFCLHGVKKRAARVLSFDFYFLNYILLICSIWSKETSIDLMKKHGFIFCIYCVLDFQ